MSETMTWPSAGAIRAAEVLRNRGYLDDPHAQARKAVSAKPANVTDVAAIIDRESGLAEAVGALKAAEQEITDLLNLMPDDTLQLVGPTAAFTWGKIQDTLAKIEGKGGEDKR